MEIWVEFYGEIFYGICDWFNLSCSFYLSFYIYS